MGSGTGKLLNHSPVMGLGQADSHGLGCLGSSDQCLALVGPQLQLQNPQTEQQPFLPVYPVCFTSEAEGTRREISVHTSISQSVIHEQQGHPKKSVSFTETMQPRI